MKVGPLLIAVLAASIVGPAGGCGMMNSLLGREQSPSQWLQQHQAKMFEEDDVPEPKVKPFTHFAAGQLLEGMNEIHQAIIQYRKALDLNPKFIGAHNRLAICLDKIGQHTEAERALRRAIKVDPDLAYLRNNLAFSLMAQKRWRDSERELRTALQLQPDYQRARVNLGIVMSKLGRRDEAFQQFQMVLGDARAHFNMGLLDKAAGRYALAAESFRNAIALEPNLAAAKLQLEKLRVMASTAPRELEHQEGLVAPRGSVVVTRVPPGQPPSIQTVRAAFQTQPDEVHDAVAAVSPTTSLPSKSRTQRDTVHETVVAAQAEPDISGMSIDRAKDPIVVNEMEDNGTDFSWEVAELSVLAPDALSDSPAPAVAVEQPAPTTAAEAPTVVAVAPSPVQPQLSELVPTAPATEPPEPMHHEIEASPLPFLTYEEPCDVRDVRRYAPRPERGIAPCADDELIDQFVLGDSGFDMTPNLTTSVPQPVSAANMERDDDPHDKFDAWTLDEWRRFARDHHLATDGSNLPSVLMRLRGDLAKQWPLPHRVAGASDPAPTMPNPAAEIELSVTRAP